MRFIGLDIGRDFAHVAVVDGSGTARRLPRLAMGDDFRSFAATLGPDDTVALEASTNTWALADLLGRHAGRIVVSNPLRTKAIASAKRKTDDIDAATLAELLAADYLPPVWQPDEATRRLRRLTSHRAGLVHDRTAVRNRVAAVLSRHLVRAPMTDVFGVRGHAWLAALELPPDERLTLDAAVRIDAVLCEQIAAAERAIAEAVVDDPRARRLLTIPGVGLVIAASILAVVGDIDRFERPAKLVSYLGLDPRVRQSGDRPATRGQDEDCRFAPAERTALKHRALDRMAGRSGTRPSQRGATGSSHDRGRARLRGGHDPHDPALRQAIDRVQSEGTTPPGA
jgi:transposase